MVAGTGLYLNLFKFVPVVLIYLLWAWTTDWVEHDTKELNNLKFATWNSVVFFSGVLGLILVLALPIYPMGLVLLLLAYFIPLFTYIYVRNQTVPDDQKVLTPYHLGEVANGVIDEAGDEADVQQGRRPGRPGGAADPVRRQDPGLAQGGPDAGQSGRGVALVHGGQGAGLRRRAPPRDRHPPRADHRAALGPVPDRRHPPRGRAVRPAHRRCRGQRVQGPLGDGHLREAQAAGRLLRRQAPGRDLDFRVATSGSKSGEKLVMRILDNSSSITKLEELGMRPKLVEQVRSLVTQPHGMFLCCGPTGAGKSTTLYAALREIDRYQQNIITVEDPIEYHLDNITQMEVNTKAGQTFAAMLRSILRQDPDVIMIGEIRDQETASIACQAANTGHMVFSTVHSNDSVTALFRLLDLGVEPFMIASALTAVMGQRLVRNLCEACKEPYKPKPEFLKKANIPADKVDVFYRRPENPEQVCPQCGGTGYFGRTGIYEMLVLSEPMRDMIRENPSINKIKAEARKGGMIYLQEDGLRQVIQGRTSIEELLRVVK